MTPLLEVKNASFHYQSGQPIFEDVSFSIQRGDLFTILGPNGAGKSTLLNCIANLLKLPQGEIMLDGKNIKDLPIREVARKVAYVSQDNRLAYGYSVRDYIVMGRAPHLGMFYQPQKGDYEMVDAAIEEMGMGHFAHKAMTQISGGERQQACIARAIVQTPELILFDEPTSALDYGNQLKTLRMIKRLSQRGYAIIMTTHNPDQPILLDGYAGILGRDGRMEIGTVGDTLSEQRLSALYGIELKMIFIDEVQRAACICENL